MSSLSLLSPITARRYKPLQICLGCRSKSKKCDKQLTHIVRVIGQALLFVSVPGIILLGREGEKFYNSWMIVFAGSLPKLWLRIG